MWAGPNTEWLKECDIKLELSGKIYERRDEVGERDFELARELVQVHFLSTLFVGGGPTQGSGAACRISANCPWR